MHVAIKKIEKHNLLYNQHTTSSKLHSQHFISAFLSSQIASGVQNHIIFILYG